MVEPISAFPEIDVVEIDPTKIAAFTQEDQFTELAFNLFRETTEYVCIVASIMGTNAKWNRDQAVVGGNMVRLFKLGCGVLDQAMQYRSETSVIFARLIYETCVNVKFLVKHFSPELVDSYVRHSLRHERRLRDTIRKNIADRGGSVLPIEDRMLKSIARAERLSGVSLDSVDLQQRAPWGGKDLRAKAASVGLDTAYLAAFGGFSHYVHGSWHDLSQYHLEIEDVDDPPAEFKPKLGWGAIRPQYLTSLSLMAIDTAMTVAEFLGGAAAADELEPKLNELWDRVMTLIHAHEQYLSGKTWPEI